jgi:hypothetical protein
MTRSEEFLRNRVIETTLRRISGVARNRGYSRFALGVFGTGAFPNVRLWDPDSGKTLDLGGRALKPTDRNWDEKHLSHYVPVVA